MRKTEIRVEPVDEFFARGPKLAESADRGRPIPPGTVAAVDDVAPPFGVLTPKGARIVNRLACLIFVFLFLVVSAEAQNNIDGFVARIYKSAGGPWMPYRLFIPAGYDKAKEYPLVIWLHGSGSVGSDNVKQISGPSRLGTHTWTTPENQAKHPAFVMAPQFSTGLTWNSIHGNDLSVAYQMVVEILESLKTEFRIDPARVYIAGQSMGGYGTWELITRRPDLFAAAIPLCGGGSRERAAAIANMSIWVFHGGSDTTVPVTESRKMIAAIKAAGGNPRYTEFKGVGHDVWLHAFKEPDLVDWVFAQRRSSGVNP